MSKVYVSIGSNIDPEDNIRSGVCTLKQLYPALTVSSVYKSKAIGLDGDDFYNLVVGFDTDNSVYEIVSQLKHIEVQHKRDRCSSHISSRTLDMDLLLYDNLVLCEPNLKIPRDEIMQYTFVLCPLSEIAGQTRHPVNGLTYNELWLKFDDHLQPLQRIDFQW